MRVVSFNIQHGRRPDGRVDTELTGAACAAFAPDVLGLQEVDRGLRRSGDVDQAAAVATATGMAWEFAPALRVGGGEYGNALLVRGSLADVSVVELPGRSGREPRALLLATAGVAGVTVSVGVTHLSTDSRTAVRQLVEVVDALWARPPPRLLLGDFNLVPRQVHAVLDAGHMSVSAPLPTFPADHPDRTIDYVAASDLVVARTRVERAAVSDHRALVTEVE